MQLLKYDDFLNRVEELGFMAFSDILEGLPSLNSETPGRSWHTGDGETDPWKWKDRAAEEKQLAFGCILGGNKGFVARRLYPVFYAACRPRQSMEERRYDGLVSQAAWDVWKLFGEHGELDTGEIRRLAGVVKKKAGRTDSAIKELQQNFYITVAGSRQKTDRLGQPYGWHINIYSKVEDWAPSGWLDAKPGMDRDEAIEEILDIGTANGKNIDRDKLARILGFGGK
ncbi:MAG TPA: hypothetical protein VHT96_18050 [Clostridia bacterium]|nr:hypothetical protein [Clostridia bacterium]